MSTFEFLAESPHGLIMLFQTALQALGSDAGGLAGQVDWASLQFDMCEGSGSS